MIAYTREEYVFIHQRLYFVLCLSFERREFIPKMSIQGFPASKECLENVSKINRGYILISEGGKCFYLEIAAEVAGVISVL